MNGTHGKKIKYEHVGNQASEQSETTSSRKNKQLYEKGNIINLGSATGNIDIVIIRWKKKKNVNTKPVGWEEIKM